MANSLKDLVTSVDWKKMMSGSDARNALIGSALGGALLGGAGLMQKRDPEESRFAPVGDALMGALLGGVAGYGIPKGLALFRDSGGLAPDGDTLKTNYLGWGLGGAAAGAGVFGGSLYKTLSRTATRLQHDALRNLPQVRANAAAAYSQSKAMDEPLAIQRHLKAQATMLSDDQRAAEDLLVRLRKQIRTVRRLKGTAATDMLRNQLQDLKSFRSMAFRGYNGLGDLLGHAALEGRPGTASRFPLLRSLLSRSWGRGKSPVFTHGRIYATRAPWWTLGLKTIGPKGHALARGGKYAAGGALLAMLAHKMLGPDAVSNYKN